MTQEHIDYLDEFKRQLFKYAIYYSIVLFVALVSFVWNTSTEIAIIKTNQEEIKHNQQDMKKDINHLIEIHMKP